MVRARFRELVEEAQRIDDHEVNVQRNRSEPTHGLNEDRSEGEIWDELSVHHVDVEEVCSRAGHARDLVSQAGEIGGQDGRANPVSRPADPAGGTLRTAGAHGCW